MMRGAFCNLRLRNSLAEGTEGGVTRKGGVLTSVFEAAMAYQQEDVPVVVVAGKDYGTGSSRDWAAKGQALLGVRAVLAQSFERIHRSNLVGMGVLPLEFLPGEGDDLTGEEPIDITLGGNGFATVSSAGKTYRLRIRLDTRGSTTTTAKAECCRTSLIGSVLIGSNPEGGQSLPQQESN